MTEIQEKRVNDLLKLGFKYNGSELHYEDEAKGFFAHFHWTDIVCMSDEEFDKTFNECKEKILSDEQEP